MLLMGKKGLEPVISVETARERPFFFMLRGEDSNLQPFG